MINTQLASQETIYADNTTRQIIEGISSKTIKSNESSDSLFFQSSKELSKSFRFYKNVSNLIETEASSTDIWLIDRPRFKIINELSSATKNMMPSISLIVKRLLGEKDIFKKIDAVKMESHISGLVKKIPREQLESITSDELNSRIEKVMCLEAMSGLLDDLSPKQRKTFERATKRRVLFG
jgi:oligoribonuclease NrnB/cAMP/cGMP phosphodiesterase (DHH superfamily)